MVKGTSRVRLVTHWTHCIAPTVVNWGFTLFHTYLSSTIKTSVSRSTITLAVRPGFYTLTCAIVTTKAIIAWITCGKKRGLQYVRLDLHVRAVVILSVIFKQWDLIVRTSNPLKMPENIRGRWREGGRDSIWDWFQHFIGWGDSAGFLHQSQSEVKQNKNKHGSFSILNWKRSIPG